MKELAQLLLAAFAAVTVENLFFSRGMGFDRILQSARRGAGNRHLFPADRAVFPVIGTDCRTPEPDTAGSSVVDSGKCRGDGSVLSGGESGDSLRVSGAVSENRLVSGAGGSQYGGTVHSHSDRIKRLEPLANGGLCNRHRICFLVRSLAACRNDSPVPSYEYAGCISGNACGVSLSGYSGAGHDGLCPKLTGT